MRIFRIACLLTFSAVVLAANVSAQIPFTFGDSSITWPGWNSGADVIGTPNFLGGTGTVTSSGFLHSLSFNYTQESYANSVTMAAGDLFIDKDANGTWDYVVKTLGIDTTGNLTPSLYSINIAESNHSFNGYVLATSGRVGHPVGVDLSKITDETYISKVNFTGWNETYNLSTTNPNVSTFTFPDNIALGNYFIISWMPDCANDVIYEKVKNPVPEPGTLILLGSGLVAAVAMRRKIKISK
jgi:hypothetical protein